MDFRRRFTIDNDKVICGRLKHYTNRISKTKGSSEESMQQSKSRTHKELQWYRCMLDPSYGPGIERKVLKRMVCRLWLPSVLFMKQSREENLGITEKNTQQLNI